MDCEVRIGASGWHYKHWRGPFYDAALPPSKMLAHYVQHFDTVEINNSFYRLPTAKAVEMWRDATPPGFLFAVKASRYITHNKKLGDPQSALDTFMPIAELLKSKLGPILFQLPPQWKVNPKRLDSFLSVLPKRHRYAIEFRNQTWHTGEIYTILRAHNAAFCIYDLAGFQTPLEITADFTYIRLHGPLGKYQGSYPAEALRAWATRIKTWRRRLKHIDMYFDNDQEAFAVWNALELKKLIPAR